MELRPTHILHRAAGAPVPLDAARLPIRTHGARSCGRCEDPAGLYRYAEVVADPTLPVTIARELLVGGDALCAACAWCVRDLKLRCAPFFATSVGVFFVRTRHLLAALLDPPPVPFVVGAPLFGAAAGGESAGWRALWSTDPPLPEGVAVLQRMQAKVCAPYCETAVSRERYRLQIDGARSVLVDVPRWRTATCHLDALATALREAGCGYTETRTALVSLALPAPARWHDARGFAALAQRWRALSAPLRPIASSDWYRLIARDLYEIHTPEKAP